MGRLIGNIKGALSGVAVLWGVYFVNVLLPFGDLRNFGIRPREIGGLKGIVFAPFLHGSLMHLVANTSALFFLLLISLTYDRRKTARAIAIIIAVSGIGTWVFGAPHSIHIGASSVIFGLVGFLLFVGIFRREARAVFASILVLFFYGGAILSLLVPMPGISWSGHFFGFVGGIYAARSVR
jgi:membrane associated rhomboid family serine protease